MVYEDFQNDYTEVDDDAKLTVVGGKVSWATYERNDNGRVFSGALANMVNFIHWFDLQISDVEAGDASNQYIQNHLVMVSVDTCATHVQAHMQVGPYQITAVDDQWKWVMRQHTGAAWNNPTVLGGNIQAANADIHYCALERNGVDLYLDDYSTALLRAAGSAGDGDNEAITKVVNATAYDHVAVCRGVNNDVTDPNDHSTGYIENYDRAGGAAVARLSRLLVGVGL